MVVMAKKKLRSGFTTGTAAAAATKAALRFLLSAKAPKSVRIDFLTEGSVDIPVHWLELLDSNRAAATVIKDAGDDPDVTHRAEIGARVALRITAASRKRAPLVTIRGGEGVGRVTKPGLEMPPGEAAINTGPRQMIQQAVTQVLGANQNVSEVDVEVYVPKGEQLALKTLNARLGIIGGISILGTTGIVKPLSHEAYTATIRSALSVARASEREPVIMTTGRRSERYAQQLFADWSDDQFIQIGDYFHFAVSTAAKMGFAKIILAVFFGKAVKMSMGVPHTHASRSALLLDRLATWAEEISGLPELGESVRQANTARHAFDMLGDRHPDIIARVGEGIVHHALNFAKRPLQVRSLIFDYSGNVVFDSESPLMTYTC